MKKNFWRILDIIVGFLLVLATVGISRNSDEMFKGTIWGVSVALIVIIYVGIIRLVQINSWEKSRPWSGLLDLINVERIKIMDVITMEFELPHSLAADMANLELKIARDPSGPFAAAETAVLEKDCPAVRILAVQDAKIDLELRAVDDANNRSAAITWNGMAADTVAPELEGEIRSKIVAETSVPDDAADLPGWEALAPPISPPAGGENN